MNKKEYWIFDSEKHFRKGVLAKNSKEAMEYFRKYFYRLYMKNVRKFEETKIVKDLEFSDFVDECAFFPLIDDTTVSFYTIRKAF